MKSSSVAAETLGFEHSSVACAQDNTTGEDI